MTDRSVRSVHFLNYLLLLLMGAVLLYLVVAFVRQVSVSQERREELARLERRIAAALEENAELESQWQHVQSDDAVEEWAHRNGWARPGEKLVVPIGEQAGQPAELQVSPEQSKGAEAPREAWWELFFGVR